MHINPRDTQPSAILEIQKWLNEKHIVVPINWVKACVEFLLKEYNTCDLPLQRLKNLVYEQWLVADLEEIHTSTLPSTLCSAYKTSLNGCFALQVNGIRDVGKPAYGQLKELDGCANADIEISAAPKAFVPEWESKPTRMLILNLTDGVNNIKGMEYTPITSLSPNLPPGIKVLITGPLDCRFGMLMLSANNIQILGGEVEKYSVKYSREELLREALNLRSKETRTSAGSNQLAQNGNDLAQSSINYVPGTAASSSATGNNENFSSLPANVSGTDTFPCENDPVDIDNFDSANDDDDDFARSLDYNALDEIERANSQAPQSVGSSDETRFDKVALSSEHEDVTPDELNIDDLTPDELNIEDPFDSEIKELDHFSSKNNSMKVTVLSTVEQDRSDKFSVIIKGFIMNVLSRLECKSSTGWHLTAKVSDGSSSIEATFHDKVLEQFVGLSAKEVMVMQVQARENAEIKDKMMKAINNCKSKLQELDCFMEIQFTPGERPCVVKCFDVDGS